MANKTALFTLIVLLLVVSACAKTAESPEKAQEKPADVDIVSETSRTKAVEAEEEVEEAEEGGKEISPEVKELLDIADKKVQSLRYSYKGPETKNFFYNFYVKGDNIKYILYLTYKTLDIDEDAYDAVCLNKKLETAQAYCDNRKCYVRGKKADIDYNEFYIWTPLDWIDNIEFAEKLGEEMIEKRNTWKLSTSNLGIIWVDRFFGVPLKAEFEGNIYHFQKMIFNDIEDEDVIPKD